VIFSRERTYILSPGERDVFVDTPQYRELIAEVSWRGITPREVADFISYNIHGIR
jgi:hypothetical protein